MLSRRRLPAITASLARRVANESALCFDVGGPAAACAPASLAGDKERVGFAAWRATMGASLSTSTSASFSFPALAGGGGGPRPLAPSAAALSSAAGSLQGSLAGSSLASKALAARPPSSRLVSMSGRASSGGSSGSGSGAALPAAARGPSIRSFSSAAAAAAAVAASIALIAVAPLSPSSCDAAAAADDADKPTQTGSKASASASASAPAPPAAATTALPSCPLCHAAPWVLALSTSPETTEILSGEALAASARGAVPAGASTSPSSPSVPSATPSPPPLASDPGSQGRQQQQQQHRQQRQQRPPGAPQQAGARARAPPFLGGDHMFSALLRHDLVRDLVALYQPAQKTMRYVIQLGPNTCGYPRVVHGGLTAAIVDEAMGFLFYALRSHGELPFRGPAFTASLTVDYRRMIQNDASDSDGGGGGGKLLLVTAEVERCEGRKLWMRATVTDGPGEGARVYAEARALFVSPSAAKLAKEAAKYVASYVLPVSFE